MSIQNKDHYFVAVKVFLEHRGKLFIFKDRFGDWDLPGGRMTKDEFGKDTALESTSGNAVGRSEYFQTGELLYRRLAKGRAGIFGAVEEIALFEYFLLSQATEIVITFRLCAKLHGSG